MRRVEESRFRPRPGDIPTPCDSNVRRGSFEVSILRLNECTIGIHCWLYHLGFTAVIVIEACFPLLAFTVSFASPSRHALTFTQLSSQE